MTGSELKTMRKAARMPAFKLAAALDISAATLSNYENDKAPIPKKVELATRYLCEPAINGTSNPEERLVAAIKEIVARA